MQTRFNADDLFAGSNDPEEQEVYVLVPENYFGDVIANLVEQDVVLIALFCAEDFGGHSGFTLFYVLEKRGCRKIVVLQLQLKGDEANSIATIFPSACWFEREISDGFGVNFKGAFDKRRLFLHEIFPKDFHPLRKDFRNVPVTTLASIKPEDEYRFKEVSGESGYQIPVGPVHAGIIEPGHFRFSVIGETIFNLEIRMFYKHRGIEKLAEGRTPDECMAVAEAISGDESAANASAFAMAVEKICKVEVPNRAQKLRVILLEMERIYSHLGDLAGMIVDVAFPKGASRFFILREEIFRQNAALTGSRFMKGIIRPGGLTRDIEAAPLLALGAYLRTFLPRFESALDMVSTNSSVVDRLETTGVIKKEIISPLNITGPAARAGGIPIDTRHDHSYSGYPQLEFKVQTAEESDVKARFYVKQQEILESIAIIRNLVSTLAPGPVFTETPITDGFALSLIESPRGQSLHWVNIKDGLIDRYKVRTASFCNWQAIEHAVLGNIVPDFPLINKSLNLSYAGTDL
jgi:formate hydrogenlyase subunit 5